jgi:RND family efflux transporter MFP subunit
MTRRTPLLAVLAVLGTAPLLGGCFGEASNAQTPAPVTRGPESRPVMAVTVAFQPQVAARTFVGTVRPRIESDLGFRVAGKVAIRHVNVGDRVKAGDRLAALDRTDFELQLAQAEAELRAAKSSLDQAEAEERRLGDLRRRGWSTESTMDRQRAAADEAQGRHERATKAVALARNALNYTTLLADADGVVTASLIEAGQVLAAGVPAVRVARLDEKEAVIAIPEILVERARTASASVTLWSDPDHRYKAVLRELAPAADAATRTYLARFTIREAGEPVRLGMTATVTLEAEEASRVARLPLAALFNQGGGPSVWVIDPATGGLRLTPVDVVAYETREVLVRAGVAEGEQVVAMGVHKLDASQRVRVVAALRDNR